MFLAPPTVPAVFSVVSIALETFSVHLMFSEHFFVSEKLSAFVAFWIYLPALLNTLRYFMYA